jgi:hypothetical protein
MQKNKYSFLFDNTITKLEAKYRESPRRNSVKTTGLRAQMQTQNLRYSKNDIQIMSLDKTTALIRYVNEHELCGYLFIPYFFKIAVSHLHIFLSESPYFNVHIPTYLPHIFSHVKSFTEPLYHNIAPTSSLQPIHHTLFTCSSHYIAQSSLWICCLTLQRHMSPKGILQFWKITLSLSSFFTPHIF